MLAFYKLNASFFSISKVTRMMRLITCGTKQMQYHSSQFTYIILLRYFLLLYLLYNTHPHTHTHHSNLLKSHNIILTRFYFLCKLQFSRFYLTKKKMKYTLCFYPLFLFLFYYFTFYLNVALYHQLFVSFFFSIF